MTSSKQPIAIVGAGYVGLVTAAGLIEQGHDVWCAERNAAKRRDLEARDFPITEPGLPEVVAEHGSRLHFAERVDELLELSRAQILLVAVGTPPLPSGEADLSQVHAVIDAIPSESTVTVVMKSTVPPGTGRAILRRGRRANKRFSYASCPEFLQEGQALDDVRVPSRIVIGTDDEATRRQLEELHAPFTEREIPLVSTDITTAEMIKHTANFHLALRISFANQTANLCEEVGADVQEVMHGIGLDARIGPRFLSPGPGFGGSCLSKDVQALRMLGLRSGHRLTLADALLAVNEDQPDRIVRKLARRLDGLERRRIALLGLAFKPETDDIRCGSAFALAQRLRHHGATVRAYDPDRLARRRALLHAQDPDRHPEWIAEPEMATDPIDAVHDADACVLVTEWTCFVELDWREVANAMTGTLVVDSRNALDPDAVKAAGLVYEGTGRHSAGLLQKTVAPELATVEGAP